MPTRVVTIWISATYLALVDIAVSVRARSMVFVTLFCVLAVHIHFAQGNDQDGIGGGLL